jgi:site-specific DNA-methyltransferase (adenine-specific)/site-specific DNA-methyltransferase (cytosine-N4-specific)
MELPSWFIKLFTKEFDTVLDPFMGSGTTLSAAAQLRRNSIGIDIVEEYCQMVKGNVKEKELSLFEFEKEEGYTLVNR